MTALDPNTTGQMAPLLSAALDYIARGWYVLPLRVGRKPDGRKDIHLPRAWDQISSNDPGVVQGWFGPGGSWADGSVAIDTGKSGLVVVDLDTSGDKNGFQRWDELGGQVSSLVHKTPSHGVHLFFAADPARPVGNDSRGKLAHGVDVRGVGGLVIAPPSSDWRGAYEVTAAGDWQRLTPVPDIVTERVPLGGQVTSPPVALDSHHMPQRDPSGLSRFVAGDGVPKYARVDANGRIQAALRRAMSTPEGQGFNHALNEAAFELGHWVAGGHLDVADAESLLSYAVTAQFPNGPNGDDLATIDSGLKGGAAKPYLVLSETANSMAPEAVASPGDFQFMDEFELENIPVPDPLVDGLLWTGSVARIFGPSSAGKTFVTLDILAHIANGMSWQGMSTHQSSVLYVAAEGAPTVGPRLAAWRNKHGTATRIKIWPEPVPIGGPSWDAFIQACVVGGFKLITLDTQSAMTAGKSEDSNSDAAVILKSLNMLARATGACVLLVHHNGWTEGDRARGASAMFAGLDTELQLTSKEGHVKLSQQKQRYAERGRPLSLRLMPHAGQLVVAAAGEPSSAAQDKLAAGAEALAVHVRVEALKQSSTADPSKSLRALVTHLRDDLNLGANDAVLRKAIHEYKASGGEPVNLSE